MSFKQLFVHLFIEINVLGEKNYENSVIHKLFLNVYVQKNVLSCFMLGKNLRVLMR